MLLTCADRQLDLSQPQVMGILNVTPDSRYGSDYYCQLDKALLHAEQMLTDGAAIIDVGGESTRPGADPVPLAEELRRVVPIVESLRQNSQAIISVDTRHSEVMEAVIAAGAHMINDVQALHSESSMNAIVKSKVAVCLMHMQGEPKTMQANPQYTDVVLEVKNFLSARVQVCLTAGISKERLVIDPGFGFGKSLQHNLQLLQNLNSFQTLNIPILVGLSRKIMLEQLLGLAVEERLSASLALAVLAASKGAAIIRTHDVRPTIEAIKTTMAVLSQ